MQGLVAGIGCARTLHKSCYLIHASSPVQNFMGSWYGCLVFIQLFDLHGFFVAPFALLALTFLAGARVWGGATMATQNQSGTH